MPRGTGGQQHLLRGDDAAGGVQPVRVALAQALDAIHGRAGVDLRAMALCGLGQAVGEAAHVHLAAALVEQAAVEALALHLAAHLRCVEDLDIGVHAVAEQALGAAFERGHLVGTRGELELAVAHEVAVDRLVVHQPRHGVDRVVVGAVPGAGLVDADLGGHIGIVHREPVVHMSAVAPRRLGRHAAAGLQHRDAGAAPGQRQRRRQAREAAADDRNVDLRRQCMHCGNEGRRGIGPIGVELHGVGPVLEEKDQRPTTPGRPPMSWISV